MDNEEKIDRILNILESIQIKFNKIEETLEYIKFPFYWIYGKIIYKHGISNINDQD